MISFLISDFDGVIRHFPAQRDNAIESSLSIPGGLIAKTAFKEELLLKVITGKISDSEWRTEIAHRLAQKIDATLAEQAVAQWGDSPGEVDFSVLQLLLDSPFGRKLCLLSNATDRLPADLTALGIGLHFFRVFNSSELKCAKPGVEIFERVRRELGCGFADMAFVDDSAKNVDAARSLGMRAHHFRGISGLKKFLREI